MNSFSIPQSGAARPAPAAGAVPIDFSWVPDAVVFLVPAIEFLRFRFMGELYVTDLLLILLLLFLLAFRRKQLWLALRRPLLKRFFFFAVLWLGSQVATDVMLKTDFTDYSRGWAKIILTLGHFTVLWYLLHARTRRLLMYTAGLAVGGVLTYLLNPNIFAQAFPWKFGVAYSATLGVILVACRVRSSKAQALLLAGIAMLHFVLDFRAMAGVCFLVSVFLMVRGVSVKDPRSGGVLKPRQVIVGAVLLVSAGALLFFGYDYAASSGLLGGGAQEKYEIQSSGEYGVVLGGRSEALIGLLAIYQSPWIGHGSWAQDPGYIEQYRQLMSQLGYESAALQRGASAGFDLDEADVISGHSHLVGAWVEAGVLGALFWAWILLLPFRVLVRLFRLPGETVPFTLFCAFMLAWDVLLSPYAGFMRFVTPFYVVVLMTALDDTQIPGMGSARLQPLASRQHPSSAHA